MSEETIVAVLKQLTKDAERHTITPNSFTEVQARQMLAGLNLLKGNEEAAAQSWLAERAA